MRKVTIFARVMNASSVLEREDSGEILDARITASARASQTLSRYAQTGTLLHERLQKDLTVMTLSPKLIEPIACGKRRKTRKSLILKGRIVRYKLEGNRG